MSKIKKAYAKFCRATEELENAMQDEYPLHETVYFKRASNQKNLSSGEVIGYNSHRASVRVRSGPTKKSPYGFASDIHVNDIQGKGESK